MKKRWHIRKLNGSLSSIAAEWDALNRRLLAAHPMMDSRFVGPLLKYFGNGHERLCLYEKNGEVAGMCILRPAKPGIWSSFIPAHSPGFPLAPMILDDTSALAHLLSALPAWVWEVDFLCQDPVFSSPSRCLELPSQRLPYALTMSISLEGSFDDYWQSRSGNLRGSLRQRINRLAKAGLRSHLVRLDDPGEMRGAVRRYANLELYGWKGRAGSAVGADNAKGHFYTEVLENFAKTGQAAVYEYWIGDRHAASQMVIFSDRMIIYLKTAYDETLANFSPGLLLLQELVRDSFSRIPGGVFEFYTNTQASPLQLAWATSQRWIEHVSLYRHPVFRQVSSALKAAWHFKGSLQTLAHRLRLESESRVDSDSSAGSRQPYP